MTQQEIEDLVLKLNEIEARTNGGAEAVSCMRRSARRGNPRAGMHAAAACSRMRTAPLPPRPWPHRCDSSSPPPQKPPPTPQPSPPNPTGGQVW